jgi:hypothetical protein
MDGLDSWIVAFGLAGGYMDHLLPKIYFLEKYHLLFMAASLKIKCLFHIYIQEFP